MSVLRTSTGLAAGIVVGLVLAPQAVTACAVCFGRSDSSLAKGMNMGILSLLAVVVLMWAALAGFFIFLARKSAAANSKGKLTATLPETTNSVR